MRALPSLNQFGLFFYLTLAYVVSAILFPLLGLDAAASGYQGWALIVETALRAGATWLLFAERMWDEAIHYRLVTGPGDLFGAFYTTTEATVFLSYLSMRGRCLRGATSVFGYCRCQHLSR